MAHDLPAPAMKTERGFSRFELLVAVTLIAAFSAVLLNRLFFYQEAAEKAAVEYTISLLKSAVRIRMATLMAEGQAGGLASLERQNPIDWLEDRQAGYTSVVANHEAAEKFSGIWQFDSADGTLTYWPIRSAHLEPDRFGMKRIRMKVVVVQEEANSPSMANNQEQVMQARVMSARLEVESYRWLQ